MIEDMLLSWTVWMRPVRIPPVLFVIFFWGELVLKDSLNPEAGYLNGVRVLSHLTRIAGRSMLA